MIPSLLRMKYFLHFMGIYGYNLKFEDIPFQEFIAIFNLTLTRFYAILLPDYPTDNHSSHIQEG